MNPKVLLGRKAFFSATRRLHVDGWNEEENVAEFGKASRLHGHDYLVEAFYGGTVHSDDGMIVNITDLKPFLAKAAAYFDGHYLNDLAEFHDALPTAENLVNCFWNHLPQTLGSGELTRLRLDESSRLWVTITINTMFFTRSYDFCAAHRLHAPDLPASENKRRYGKCNNPAGHGHNYTLEVTLEGNLNPQTGQLAALPQLDQLVEETVIDRFDHRHLNEDCPEFKDIVPTSENLAKVIFNLLDPLLESPHSHLAKVGLHETYKNYFEVER
ncbi:MAG: 6-carboxytetrahydropterin synthase [Abditibacteriaceae bacterium]